MKIVDARTGIETLDRQQCLRLLAEDEIGRLAVIDGTSPVIFPGQLPARRRSGRLPHRARHEAPRQPAVAGIVRDRPLRPRQPVGLERRRHRTTQGDHALRDVHVRPRPRPRRRPWADNDKPHWMRLVPSRITGRRVGTIGV